MIQITDNEDYIWSLIAGALSGNISEKERLELDSWRQQSAEHESIFENAKRIWDETGKVNFTFDVDNAWIKTRLRIDDSYGSKGKKSKKLLVIYVAAASILLVIASTFFIGQLYQSTIRISTFQTTKKIVLSDGTVVDLNRNSQIEYPRKFKGNYRQVKLMKGEAFFTVSSDPLRPFLVYTPAASIKVLGTRFNVIVDREGNVEVLVQSGRVSFHASETNESLILTPNQKAIYAAGSKAMVKSDTVDWNQLAWCTSRFIFKEADLAYVYGVLSRTYGKTIVPDTQILRNKLTATYEKLELDDILQIIDKTFILKTTRLNDTLYLVRQTQP